MSKKMSVRILPGEHWYGGACFDGIKMPFGSESDFVRDLNPNSTMNQAAPLLLSDKGRYIWSDTGFSVSVKNGEIGIENESGEVSLCEGYATLRGGVSCRNEDAFSSERETAARYFFCEAAIQLLDRNDLLSDAGRSGNICGKSA